MSLAGIALIFFLSVPAFAQDSIQFHKASEAEINRHIHQVHQGTPEFLKRVEIMSRGFLGMPFEWGPLGEGEKGRFDNQPLISFEKVDCVTFVEQTMAMALSRDLKNAKTVLNKIRYHKGRVDYESRNHFASVDWIPNNIQAGYLKDITREVAGDKTQMATKTISKKAWYLAKSTNSLEGSLKDSPEADKEKLVRQWQMLGEKYKDEKTELPIVPMKHLPDFVDKIPSGAVVTIVRQDKESIPVLVSHQGFLIRENGKAYLRHASFNDKVVDTPFLEYFYKFYNASWPIVGLNLTLPN